MTEDELDLMERLSAAATPAPWRASGEEHDSRRRIHTAAEDLVLLEASTADRDFIIAFRNEIEPLVREMRALRADEAPRMNETTLRTLTRLARAASPAPWVSWVEGRDFPRGGSSFIQLGAIQDDKELEGPSVGDQDLIAALRNRGPELLKKVCALRLIGAADQGMAD